MIGRNCEECSRTHLYRGGGSRTYGATQPATGGECVGGGVEVGGWEWVWVWGGWECVSFVDLFAHLW